MTKLLLEGLWKANELSAQMLKQLPSQCNNLSEFKGPYLRVRPLHDAGLHQWQCMSTYAGRVWTTLLLL